MTSGTLAYSFGLGKAVVSTPYWHARELLADGRGILVPFGDAAAIGSEIAGLLTDDARRQAMRKRAYASSRSMTWERTAERYLAAFESGRGAGIGSGWLRGSTKASPSRDSHAPPEMQTRSSSVDVRRHRAVPACDPFGARSLPRLLRRRQCPGAAVGLCAQQPRRAAPARGVDGPIRGLRPACLESGYQAVSQLHELRSTLARGQRLGGQPRADALGLGRVRAQRCQPVAAALGRRPVRRSAAGGGELSARRAPGPSRCSGWTPIAPQLRRIPSPSAVRHLLADRLMSILSAVETRGLGLVRGRACLRQRAPAPGPDRHRDFDRSARLCRGRA